MTRSSNSPTAPLAHMVSRFSTAEVLLYPYPHFYLENVFPDDYYHSMLHYLPDSSVYQNLWVVTDLKLDQLTVIYPGAKSYELGPQVKVIPVSAIATEGIDDIVSARRMRFRAKGRSRDGSSPS